MKKCRSCDVKIEKSQDSNLCGKCLAFVKILNGAKLFDMVEMLAAALDSSLMLGDSMPEETKKEYEELKEQAWKLLREIEK